MLKSEVSELSIDEIVFWSCVDQIVEEVLEPRSGSTNNKNKGIHLQD